MSAFQDAPKPRIVRFIRGFTNFSVDPYYDPLSLVMILSYIVISLQFNNSLKVFKEFDSMASLGKLFHC